MACRSTTVASLLLLLLLGGGGCVRGTGELTGDKAVLIGVWVSPSGARLQIDRQGSCVYRSSTETVEQGALAIYPQGQGGTLRCRTLFGGVSLTVDRWPINDYRGPRPRTYLTLSGVEYERKPTPEDAGTAGVTPEASSP